MATGTNKRKVFSIKGKFKVIEELEKGEKREKLSYISYLFS
jgi:hypothetical protein